MRTRDQDLSKTSNATSRGNEGDAKETRSSQPVSAERARKGGKRNASLSRRTMSKNKSMLVATPTEHDVRPIEASQSHEQDSNLANADSAALAQTGHRSATPAKCNVDEPLTTGLNRNGGAKRRPQILANEAARSATFQDASTRPAQHSLVENKPRHVLHKRDMNVRNISTSPHKGWKSITPPSSPPLLGPSLEQSPPLRQTSAHKSRLPRNRRQIQPPPALHVDQQSSEPDPTPLDPSQTVPRARSKKDASRVMVASVDPAIRNKTHSNARLGHGRSQIADDETERPAQLACSDAENIPPPVKMPEEVASGHRSGDGIASLRDGRASKASKRYNHAAENAKHGGQEQAEDVDWMLFSASAAKSQDLARKKVTKTAATSLRSKTRLPDIDLDDLISDIAKFAEKDGLKDGRQVRARSSRAKKT